MARDRKQRAKQRRTRKPSESPSEEQSGALVRSELPGALDHSSGDVDEFDAAIVRGAGGVPAPVENPEAEQAFGDDARVEPALDSPAGELSSARSTTSPEARRPPGNRVLAFMRASWAELQRVQWPDRRQVFQATAVVLGFVVVAGVYLGAADWVAQRIVNFIL